MKFTFVWMRCRFKFSAEQTAQLAQLEEQALAERARTKYLTPTYTNSWFGPVVKRCQLVYTHTPAPNTLHQLVVRSSTHTHTLPHHGWPRRQRLPPRRARRLQRGCAPQLPSRRHSAACRDADRRDGRGGPAAQRLQRLPDRRGGVALPHLLLARLQPPHQRACAPAPRSQRPPPGHWTARPWVRAQWSSKMASFCLRWRSACAWVARYEA